MLDFFKKINAVIEIDRHVFMALSNRFSYLIFGLITISIMPLFFTPEQQGYYFTFNNLIALQLFFEMGLNFVIAQFVSHEIGKINFSSNGDISPLEEKSRNRLLSIFSLVKNIYPYMSVLYFLLVAPLGIYFFYLHPDPSIPIESWMIPWLIVVACAAVNLYVSPYLSIAEGGGEVAHISSLRLLQNLLGYTFFWVAMVLNAGILSAIFIPLVSLIISLIWLYKNKLKIMTFRNLKPSKTNDIISWKKEIFPFQWRISISWMSGYLIFQLFNPLAFANLGAIEAGKLGLTLSAYSAVLTLSISWLNAKMPYLARLFSTHKNFYIRKEFSNIVIRTFILNFLGCITLTFLILYLKNKYPEYGDRFLNLKELILLSIVMLSNHVIFSVASFYRANKKEVFLSLSLVIGLLNCLLMYIFSHHSVFYMVLSYTALIVFLNLPWAIFIYLSKRD